MNSEEFNKSVKHLIEDLLNKPISNFDDIFQGPCNFIINSKVKLYSNSNNSNSSIISEKTLSPTSNNKKENKVEEFKCDLCNKQFKNSSTFEAHLKSSKHLNNLKLSKKGNAKNNNTNAGLNGKKALGTFRMCNDLRIQDDLVESVTILWNGATLLWESSKYLESVIILYRVMDALALIAASEVQLIKKSQLKLLNYLLNLSLARAFGIIFISYQNLAKLELLDLSIGFYCVALTIKTQSWSGIFSELTNKDLFSQSPSFILDKTIELYSITHTKPPGDDSNLNIDLVIDEILGMAQYIPVTNQKYKLLLVFKYLKLLFGINQNDYEIIAKSFNELKEIYTSKLKSFQLVELLEVLLGRELINFKLTISQFLACLQLSINNNDFVRFCKFKDYYEVNKSQLTGEGFELIRNEIEYLIQFFANYKQNEVNWIKLQAEEVQHIRSFTEFGKLIVKGKFRNFTGFPLLLD
ncbi:hypothetical protein CONCODRAFT_86734 [Conidiobolus coronatus NRRL 28638]|uniref:C2H2-type domain-containing protein n=1 Tax=Conidiobolus coronatus (strain ATCC 28846 / CBS 209.66 / NRRL 28638) TaxID=796925 RepID=A0A137NYF1_CONC2|nr:hypothetical protein CONCODRAFT_86734 [Conidiobolus coronatus NRRL 28638]|eukprot:KXN67893.1 hypothetical protein CONCODRAFT_86734 [Conidiobolus coronatus NRRL 28638]